MEFNIYDGTGSQEIMLMKQKISEQEKQIEELKAGDKWEFVERINLTAQTDTYRYVFDWGDDIKKVYIQSLVVGTGINGVWIDTDSGSPQIAFGSGGAYLEDNGLVSFYKTNGTSEFLNMAVVKYGGQGGKPVYKPEKLYVEIQGPQGAFSTYDVWVVRK